MIPVVNAAVRRPCTRCLSRALSWCNGKTYLLIHSPWLLVNSPEQGITADKWVK
jgi:hypothetical protein